MKLRLIFIISIILFAGDTFAQLPEPRRYLPNSGAGLMCDDNEVLGSLTGYNAKASNLFTAIYLSEVLTDEYILPDGNVDETLFYQRFQGYLDWKFKYFKTDCRFIVRVFPTINASSPTFYTQTISSDITPDGNVLIGYPSKIYNIIEKGNYPPTYLYRDDATLFKGTRNFSVVDFRDEHIFSLYDVLLRCLSKYFDETINRQDVNGNVIKKGDFVEGIEMGFIGPWGEGNAKALDGHCDYNSLVKIAELYKQHLSGYNLIAPTYGMRIENAPNDDIIRFQYYLATTTYGSLKKDRNGCYFGNKEFGLFVDHWGTLDTQRDYTLTKYGSLSEIAHGKKYKALVVGENCGRFEWESQRIKEQIIEYGVSLLKPWGNISELTSEGAKKWRNACTYLGYHFRLNRAEFSLLRRRIRVDIQLANEGSAPCLSNYWHPTIVIKEKASGNTRMIIDLKDYLDLTSYGSLLSCSIKTKKFSRNEIKAFSQLYDVLFVIRDIKAIAPNMSLESMDYKENNNNEYSVLLK